jgi:tetratricopeptide (TPR) repeat protein
VIRATVALVVALAGAAPVAHAAPGPPAAVDHYQVGKRLFEQKRYDQALSEFHQALALTPRPEVLYSMAQTQRLLGDCERAVDTYLAFLAARPGEPLAGYAHANIDRCEREVAVARDAAWYRDVVGDALVGGGLIVGVTGAVAWRSGRGTAPGLAELSDSRILDTRPTIAAPGTTEQQLGVAAMIVGGVAIAGGIVHYVHRARSVRRDAALGVALTSGGALIAGSGTF